MFTPSNKAVSLTVLKSLDFNYKLLPFTSVLFFCTKCSSLLLKFYLFLPTGSISHHNQLMNPPNGVFCE